LVGAFVIWNTFAVTVAQRRREIALLRAVGATRRQMLGGIIIEAATIGLISAALGLGAGVGLAVGIRQLLKIIGLEMPTTTATIEPRTILAAVSVGVIVTVAAAIAPALSAMRVSPVEALRDGDPTSNTISRRRRAWGWALLALGAAGMTVAAMLGNRPWFTGAATLVTFAGLVVSGPTLAVMLATLADRGRRGTARRMAARNIGRAARRAAATALALTIGLSVVAAVAVVASSLKDSVTEAVESGNRSDFIVAPVAASGGVSPEVAGLLRRDPEVDTVVEFRQSGAMVAGDVVGVVGADPDGLERVLDLGVTEGSLRAFENGTILLGTDQAEALDVTVGDQVPVTFPETGQASLRVAAVFEDDLMIGWPYVVTMADFESRVTSRVDTAVMLTLTADASRAGAEGRLADLLGDFPNVEVSDPAERTEAARDSVDQLLGLVTALLLLAVVVAVLGIMNTLALSVVERTRELGLLRAVGATRHQVAGVIRDESVLMAVLGAVTGLGLGTGAGVALSRALADEGITTVSLPTTLLAIYLVVAIIIGILAALGPARRASRVDVLTAITVE
jgi:putative ABC transport system permease protein